MTDGVAPRAGGASGEEGRDVLAELIGGWAATASTVRVALSMIPTPQDRRSRVDELVRELDRVAAPRSRSTRSSSLSSSARPLSVDAPADLLVELTLAGLREPASARPYDAERADELRRRVLQVLVGVADGVAGVEVRAAPRDSWVIAEILAAGRLARALLDDEPVGSHS